jgi:peroxin-1
MRELRISPIPLKNVFVNLPLKWTNALFDSIGSGSFSSVAVAIAFRQSDGNRIVYLGWTGGSSSPVNHQDTVELDVQLAKNLGLKSQQLVNVEIIHQVPAAKSISVEPLTIDDWEILELNAGYLESQFLNQCRIVYPGEIITIWFYNQASVQLRIGAYLLKQCLLILLARIVLVWIIIRKFTWSQNLASS